MFLVLLVACLEWEILMSSPESKIDAAIPVCRSLSSIALFAFLDPLGRYSAHFRFSVSQLGGT
jgi:hypothetical protein